MNTAGNVASVSVGVFDGAGKIEDLDDIVVNMPAPYVSTTANNTRQKATEGADELEYGRGGRALLVRSTRAGAVRGYGDG